MITSAYELLGLRPLAGRRSAAHVVPLCAALVAAVALADYLTGYQVRLAILYLGPIALATWTGGRRAGIAMAVLAAAGWLVVFESNHPYTHDFYFYWEGGITFAVHVMFVGLLARLREALEHSDERLITVLESADAAVEVHEAGSGETLYANRRFRDAFGARRDAPAADGEVFDAPTARWYLQRSRPLRWIDGRDAVLRVLSDVSEERRARELVAKHREAAHRTSRLVALGEFASAIAHELNQPLAAIATYNNASLLLLQKSGAPAAELQEAMQKCREQALRAGAIIQRLREVLRQPVPALASQDLNELARNAAELAEPQAVEAGVRLDLRLAGALPAVRTDRVLVEQVALNLLRNAIEAVQGLPPERRRVALVTAADEGGVTLEVTDAGEGVPPDVEPRLFEAFVTTKPRGLGLGLSICRSVVESLGGSIRYSAGAPGARFRLALPGDVA